MGSERETAQRAAEFQVLRQIKRPRLVAPGGIVLHHVGLVNEVIVARLTDGIECPLFLLVQRFAHIERHVGLPVAVHVVGHGGDDTGQAVVERACGQGIAHGRPTVIQSERASPGIVPQPDVTIHFIAVRRPQVGVAPCDVERIGVVGHVDETAHQGQIR